LDMNSDVSARTSEVRYANCAGAHIAYRLISGDSPETHDVILVTGGTASMEAWFDDAIGARLLDGLAGLGRLVVFDRRGIGLSDPPETWDGPSFERWSEDIAAVVEAADLAQLVIVGNLMSFGATVLFCDRHPENVGALVLLEPGHPRRADIADDWVHATLSGELDMVATLWPSRADDPTFREWFDRAGRIGASPTTAARAMAVPSEDETRDIEQAASRVRRPVLVLRRPEHPLSPEPSIDPIVGLLPTAVRVDLPGLDAHITGGEVDALLAEVARFVTGKHRLPAPERLLAAVLFSDLVESTARASALGDAQWKRVLDRHDAVVRSCVSRRGGTVINTTGDGVVATLVSTVDALHAAEELRVALGNEGLKVRVGINVGDVYRRAEDVSGLAVIIAARIMSLAGPGEILVSNTVRLAATGAPVQFEPRGEHMLKGVPGQWELYACAPSGAPSHS
jgi:class 3 adenylate cyclase/alpha-beta hydrolase superfamily lysophospholipase